MALGVKPGSVGDSVADVAGLTRDIETGMAIALQSASRAADVQLVSEISRPFTTARKKATIPYFQANSVARWHKIGTPIVSGELAAEEVTIELEKISDGVSISTLDATDPDLRAALMGEVESKAMSLQTRILYRIAEILEGGDTDTDFVVQDGEQLFSTTHSLFGRTYSNIVTGNLDPTDPTAFEAAVTRSRNIPWTNGEYLPMQGAQRILMVPPGLAFKASSLVDPTKAFQTNINSDNPYAGIARVVVTEALQNADNWYLITLLNGLTPFTWARHAVYGNWQMIDKSRPEDENVHQRDMLEWDWFSYQTVWPTGYPFVIKGIGGQS